jgi:hypothetical protein
MNNLKKWLIFGIVFVTVLGTLSHFIYEWSGQNPLAGLFVAVNESTWEHIKIAIFPSLILIAIQYHYFKGNNNFLIGSFLSMLAIILLIPIFFYGYQAILGDDFLILDIIDFIVSIIIGQFIFYRVMKSNELPKAYKISSIVGIVVIIVCYLTFSYYPPHNFLFEDPITHKYGVEGHSNN